MTITNPSICKLSGLIIGITSIVLFGINVLLTIFGIDIKYNFFISEMLISLFLYLVLGDDK